MTRPPARSRSRTRLRGLAIGALCLVAVAAFVLLRREEQGGAPPPPERPPTLADLWEGHAGLVLARKWTSRGLGAPGGGAYEGAHVEVVGRTWYLFDRRRTGTPCPGRANVQAMATQARASTDQGRTWGPPQDILTPTEGTPWACAATDGDAAWNADTGTWQYLFQCLGAGGEWAGCLAERRDPSPVGPFSVPDPKVNPVLTSGQLWSRICNEPADRCARPGGPRPIGDEGTFTLLPAAGGSWWVSFHGYDGVHGYRGLARTKTFRRGDWQVDGQGGTPTDAILTAQDAAGWREDWRPGGPVGPGAAGLLQQNGAYYALAEVPDENLGCTAGQTWDLGLFRAASPSSTNWEGYPRGNPLVYSSRAPGPDGKAAACNVEYPNLFTDPATGETFVMFGRVSADPAYDAIYVYRLEWNRNLLGNGDFWRADTYGWHAFAGTSTQLSVPRTPDGSPDGSPYLAFNCGAAACDGAASVYQDAAVGDRLAHDTIAFGGTLGTDGARGRVEVALVQLDASGREVTRTVKAIDATPRYARLRASAELDGRTRTVRFQLYPRSPVTFRADNLYAIPQDGCTAPRYPAC